MIKSLGTQDFPRVRLGIDPGHPVENGAGVRAFSNQEGADRKNWMSCSTIRAAGNGIHTSLKASKRP